MQWRKKELEHGFRIDRSDSEAGGSVDEREREPGFGGSHYRPDGGSEDAAGRAGQLPLRPGGYHHQIWRWREIRDGFRGNRTQHRLRSGANSSRSKGAALGEYASTSLGVIESDDDEPERDVHDLLRSDARRRLRVSLHASPDHGNERHDYGAVDSSWPS